MNFPTWTPTCKVSHVKFHMWNFTCEIPHVKNPMWNITCATHVFFINIIYSSTRPEDQNCSTVRLQNQNHYTRVHTENKWSSVFHAALRKFKTCRWVYVIWIQWTTVYSYSWRARKRKLATIVDGKKNIWTRVDIKIYFVSSTDIQL